MIDIVERLRVRNVPYGYLELMDKAAAEIDRLRAACKNALEAITDDNDEIAAVLYLKTALGITSGQGTRCVKNI